MQHSEARAGEFVGPHFRVVEQQLCDFEVAFGGRAVQGGLSLVVLGVQEGPFFEIYH
jgi:hypothetical protein